MAANGNRSRTTVVVVAVVAALALLACGCICSVTGVAILRGPQLARALQPWSFVGGWRLGQVEATQALAERLAVGSPASLEIQAGVANVRIEPGDDGEVQITGSKHAWGSNRAQAEARLSEYRVDVRQTGDGTVVIETQAPGGLAGGNSPRVDLVIAVPRRTDVRAVLNVGALRVRGLEGEFDLSTSVGDVEALDVTLRASSRVASNVGSVHVRLPADASFVLDARTQVGSLSSGFELAEPGEGRSLVGKSLSGSVGNAPSITLTLRTNTGDIRLERGE